MNDDIRKFQIYGRLMAGNSVDESCYDPVVVENLLYHDFGMSSEEILENFRSCSDMAFCK